MHRKQTESDARDSTDLHCVIKRGGGKHENLCTIVNRVQPYIFRSYNIVDEVYMSVAQEDYLRVARGSSSG